MTARIKPMSNQKQQQQVMLEIINMYKNMPHLWDKNHQDYSNRTKRNNANQIMFEVYKQLDKEATIQGFTKRILNLRTNYYKELRKFKESLSDDIDGKEVYEPTLWYYDAFSFLEDVNEHSPALQDPLKTETTSPSPSLSDDTETCRNSDNSPLAKKRKSTNPIVYKAANSSSLESEIAADNATTMKNKECEIFGKSVGLQLRDLEKTQLTIAQKMISDAIYYAKFGLLNQKSYVNLGTPPS